MYRPLKDKLQDQAEVNVDSTTKAAALCFFICLSPVYYGYSLTIIGASNLSLVLSYYQVTTSTQVALALFNGSLPLGGVLGCLLFPKLRPLTTKKKLHYYLAIFTVAVCGLSIVPYFEALTICRFGLGIISAQYMALAVNLIKEHFPDYEWRPYGALFSAMRILGILVCYILGQMFSQITTAAGNMALFFGPAFISVIQALYLAWRLPESPVQLLRAKQPEAAAKSLEYLYAGKDVMRRLNQLQLKIDRAVPSKFDDVSNPLNICGIHLALLRQFCGVTYLVVYASTIPLHNETSLGNAALVVENTLQMVGGLIGIIMVRQFSRYYLVTVSTYIALFLNILLGVGSILEMPVLSFIVICIFMFTEGSALTSVAWTYPAELCTPKIERYAALTSMAGTTIVTVVPPFVVAHVQDHEAYPIFFFFAVYLVVAIALNANLLPRDQISDKNPLEFQLSGDY